MEGYEQEATGGIVVQIMANIFHSRETGLDKKGEVWLTGQLPENERIKYGRHLPIHGIYAIGDVNRVIGSLNT